jgi:tellurite resistance protein TerC
MSSIDVPIWAWALLGGLLVVSIAVDLIAHRGDHEDSRRSAILWTLAWIGIAAGFGVFVGVQFGATAAEQFAAAYLLEKSLSLDNLFLFIVIFASLGIPRTEQRRVLTFGILGALATRLLFILVGAAAIHRWHELTYVLGALLVFTAFKLLRHEGPNAEPPGLLLWLERHLPWTRRLHGHAFLAKENGRRVATPLLVALITIELADVLFAIDSVPAAFAISDDTFIVYSSNVLAVLGLRALYIVLANALRGLRYLHFGLAAIVGFAGIKMLIASWVKFPPLVSVLAIVGMMGIAVIASVRANRARPGGAIVPGET